MVYSVNLEYPDIKDSSESMAAIKSKMLDEQYRYEYLVRLSEDPIAALKEWRSSMTKDWHSIVDAKELQHSWKEHAVRYAYMQSLAQ